MDIAMKADLDQWLARARHDRRRGVPMNPDDIMVRWIVTYGWNPEQPMDGIVNLFENACGAVDVSGFCGGM
jgi:hypothetical protein